MGVQTLRAAVT